MNEEPTAVAAIKTRLKKDEFTPRGWKWVDLKDVARLESGHTPSRRCPEYWKEGDIPWLSLKDIRGMTSRYVHDTINKPNQLGIDNSSARLLPAGTVALCRTASVGNAAILGCEMATSQDFVNWVCGPEVSPEYLYEAFKTSASTFAGEKQGSTHQTIYMPTIRRFKLLLPPLSEQKRIADILDRANTIRRKRREALGNLLQIPGSLHNEMFGTPSDNDRGYETGTIRDLVREVKYGTSGKAGATGEYAVLRMNNITYEGMWDLSDLKYIDIAKKDKAKHLVTKGDLLFNRTNSRELVGKTAVYQEDEPMAFAGYLVRARTNDLAHADYISGYLNSPHGKATLRHMCKSIVGMANINAQEFQNIEILKPPIEKQLEYVQVLDCVREKEKPMRTAIAEADDLFHSLVQRAFKGEL